MIIGPDDVTAAVLSEVEHTRNPRTKELLAACVKHLHAFVRETNLTEAEFQHIARIIAKLGQLSNESHNEVVLIAGSLGVSSLVCLQNNRTSPASAPDAQPLHRSSSRILCCQGGVLTSGDCRLGGTAAAARSAAGPELRTAARWCREVMPVLA
jgi:hypothetical protein